MESVISKKLTETQLSETTAKWFAIYTRFKGEKEVVRLLAKKNIESYLPLNRLVKQYKSKRKIVELPLINCYVFVRITKKQYVPVLETNNVLKFIQFSKRMVAIPDPEIELLRRICQEQMDIEVEQISFQKGKAVEIIGGNLTGVHGILVSEKGKNFVVQLDHIGWGLHMEIDSALVRSTRKKLRSSDESTDPGTMKKYW